MSSSVIYALGGAVLWAIGLTAFAVLRHLLRRLIAFNVMGSGTFLVLVGVAHARGTPDPVPQALVLTGIVVALAATALGVVLIRRWFHVAGRASLDAKRDLEPDQES
jgi:multicomponent Na+:H+ antiporter subunit C